MSDRATLVRDGEHAKTFLKDPTFTAAVAAARQKYVEAMIGGKTTEERERAWLHIAVLDEVVSQLSVFVGRGTMAQAELDRQASREKPDA